MHANKVSQNLLDNSLPWMHQTRRAALQACVLAAIDSRSLSVTGMGRSLHIPAKEKHCIKRADRLLSNSHLHSERKAIYHTLTQ